MLTAARRSIAKKETEIISETIHFESFSNLHNISIGNTLQVNDIMDISLCDFTTPHSLDPQTLSTSICPGFRKGDPCVGVGE